MRSLVIIFSCFFKIFFSRFLLFLLKAWFLCVLYGLFESIFLFLVFDMFIFVLHQTWDNFNYYFFRYCLYSFLGLLQCLIHLMVSHRSLRLFSHFFSFYSSCCSDSIISIILDSSSLIIYSACSKLSLNHPSSKLIIPVTVLFSFRIACWVLLRFSISLLIFPFYSYIILFTEKINIKS